MPAIAHAWNSALLHFLWQGLVVAGFLRAGLFLLRKRSANARYAASCAALALMAILPLATAWTLYSIPVGERLLAPQLPRSGSEEPGRGSAPGAPLAEAEAWMLPLWFAGLLAFSVRIAWSAGHVGVLRSKGALPEEVVLAMVARLADRMGVKRRLRVLLSRGTDGPCVVGWIRPVLLLPPATLLGLTPEQLEAVLAHELAHVRRYDYLVNVVQTMIETALFYHPAVWWVSGRIRHERELACDDAAVAYCGDAVFYARALARLEKLRPSSWAYQLAMTGTGGSLMYRIQRLVGAAPREVGLAHWPSVVSTSLGLLCLALATNWSQAQNALWTYERVPAQSQPVLQAQVVPPAPQPPRSAGIPERLLAQAAPPEPQRQAMTQRVQQFVQAQTVQFLKEQTAIAETELTELRTRYTESHPEVVRARARVADLRQKLQSAQIAGTLELQPADTIRVSVSREQSLTGNHEIGTDGKIVLPLLGNVQAAGMTMDQLAAQIQRALGQFLRDPRVEVTVLRVNRGTPPAAPSAGK